VPHWINLILGGAEHPPCIRNRLPELEQRGAHLLEPCLIPVGDFECAGTLLAHLDRILQSVDLLNILVFEHAQRRVDLSEAVDRLVSNISRALNQLRACARSC